MCLSYCFYGLSRVCAQMVVSAHHWLVEPKIRVPAIDSQGICFCLIAFIDDRVSVQVNDVYSRLCHVETKARVLRYSQHYHTFFLFFRLNDM